LGKLVLSAFRTVSPPIPLSNTPIGKFIIKKIPILFGIKITIFFYFIPSFAFTSLVMSTLSSEKYKSVEISKT